MVLHPLEFSECHLDSPWFRENVQQYEEELERTSSQIKQLIKDGRSMLNACRTQGKLMTQFNDRLQNFHLDFGANLTDDEKRIAGSLKEFGLMLEEVAGEWFRTIERSESQLLKPLEEFRKDHIHSYRESKKTFEKTSERYYKQLEHSLGLSHKKKQQQLEESDNELSISKKNFHSETLNYVYKLQEIQERKKFEFIEHLLVFMQVYFNYFHQTHETALDCKDYMTDLQMRLVATRERYTDTKDKTETLMKRMLDQPGSEGNSSMSHSERWSRSGYLFLMEKHPLSARLTSKWSKYFCMYKKENKLFQMVAPYHPPSNTGSVGGKVTASNSAGVEFLDPMIVSSCTRRSTDSIDKRFCFDLSLEDTSGKQFAFTFQALSDVDRKKWMSVMDGKEPAYVQTKDFKNKENVFELNEAGFECVKAIIAEIERRGTHHEGIYRLVGVLSKVDALLRQSLSTTAASVNYSDEDEWETNTLTSALKSYFRNLPEPIMTFDLHQDFINAAKCDLHDDRVEKISALVNKLPENNRKMLAILVEHLEKVQEHHEKNKMTVQNLGVCFGPTIMRQRQETVQAIMEIKFSNIIVEILVEERHVIFGGGGSLLGVEKGSAPERPPSPRIASKALSYAARPPSQRIKQRPRGAVYEVAFTPTLREEDEDHRTTDAISPRFSRSMAFRENMRRSPSPRSNQDEKRASQMSTSSEENGDDPMDSNLVNFDRTKPLSKSGPAAFPNNNQTVRRGAQKENWPLNGGEKLTKKTLKPAVPPKNPELARSHSPNRAVTGCAPVAKKDPKQTLPAPHPKKRFSALLHPNAAGSAGDGQADKGKNRNNNNSMKDCPSKPSKPKSLPVALSIKQALSSPKMPVKMRRQNLKASKSLANTNISSSPSLERKNVNRRPKSEFIPAVFLASEMDDGEVATDPKNPPEKSASFKREILKNENTKAIPRSSAVLSARTPELDEKPTSFSDSSDESDPGRTSNRVRALYTCLADKANELSFQQGQIIRNVEKSNEPGWLHGMLNGRSGLVPRNYVEYM